MSAQRIDLGRHEQAGGGCCGTGACADDGVAAGPAASMPGRADGTTDLLVEGMTCDHCVRAVAGELSQVAGVAGVDVELVPGGASRVRLRIRTEPEPAALAAAVEAAGYALRD